MASNCIKCNKPFPKKPNGASHGYAHFAALLDHQASGGPRRIIPGFYNNTIGGGGKGKGKGKGSGGNKGNGGAALDKLTELVTSLAKSVNDTNAALGVSMSRPASFPSLGPAANTKVAGGGNSPSPATGNTIIKGRRVAWAQQATTSPDAQPEKSSEDGIQDALAEKLASEHQIPTEAATKMADILRANQKPILPPVRKYTAVFQEFSNSYQSANKTLQESRLVLGAANKKMLAAMDALDAASQEAEDAAHALETAKAECSRTWEALQNASVHNKSAPKTVDKLSVLQEAAKLLAGIPGASELEPLRHALNVCMAAAVPAGVVTPEGEQELLSPDGGKAETAPVSSSDVNMAVVDPNSAACPAAASANGGF